MTSPRPPRRVLLPLLGTIVVVAVVLAVLALPGGTAPLKGDDKAKADVKERAWPLFGGTLQRNLVNTVDRNMPTDWKIVKATVVKDPSKSKNIKWAAELGSKAYGGPIFSGGKIFIGTNNNKPRNPAIHGDKGVMMCFRESDGQFLWQAVHDKLPAGRVNDWPDEGICSSPFVEGDRLYYVCNRCEVICASVNGYDPTNKDLQPTQKGYESKQDGGVYWRLDMIKELGVFPHNLSTCSPLVAGDTLFVITSNGVDEDHINIPAPAAPSFVAIDKKKGKVLWKDNSPSVNAISPPAGGIKALVDKGMALMHGQWSNPVYAEANGRAQIIFPGGDGWIRSFNPRTGELLWKFDCNPKAAFYELGEKATRNDFVCTPVVWENKLYIGVGQDPEHKKGVGHLWCMDITKTPTNKDKDVSPLSDPKDENPTFDPKDPKNKESALVWHFGGFAPAGAPRPWIFGRTLSTCSVHDGLCYAGEYDGYLHCLDANTGKEYWQHKMDADTWASPYWVDNKIYIGNEGGEMLIFKHGKEKEEPKSIEMAAGVVRATPVAFNGVLYSMTENPCRLYAIKK
jgi:outer membrane protein assembly factor BamB